MTRCTCPTHKGNPSPAPAAEKRLRAIVGELLKLQGDDAIARLCRIMRGDPLEKGGSGSGNFGHAGRPGEVGGSGEGVVDKEKADSVLRSLKQKEEHWAWQSVMEHRFPELFRIPLDSQEQAQQESDAICKELGIKSAKILFSDKVSSDAYADYAANLITFYPNEEQTTGRLVHELAHHVNHVLRGGEAWDRGPQHGAGFNKEYRVTAEAFLRVKGNPLELNDWWRGLKRGGKVPSQKSLSLKSTTPLLLSPKWDERVVRATMPLLLGVFKAGGDEALGQIRKFPRSAKGMAWFPASMIEGAERVEWKGGAGSGNFGHEGRPGEVGGSGDHGITTIAEFRQVNGGIGSEYDVEGFFEQAVMPLHNQNTSNPLKRYAKEHPREFARLQAASLFNAWQEETLRGRTNQSFEKWRETPVTIYRGVFAEGREAGQSWTFSKQTAEVFSKRGAARFSSGGGIGKVIERQIVPDRDIFYTSNAQGEAEILLQEKSLSLKGAERVEWKEANQEGWIGVDLDGTLAEYDGFKGDLVIGTPIPRMVERVKRWIKEGKDVRIFTARIYQGEDRGKIIDQAAIINVIQDWSEEYLGKRLPVTCEKDHRMIELWDDRAVQVIPNTGKRVDGKKSLSQKASDYLSFDDFMDRYMADSPVSIASWIDQPEVVQAAEREAYQFAQQINQTTADALREVIVMGMENGDSIKTIANRISNLSDEWAEGWRAEMIARTETARVYTSGRIEAWRATGVVQRKVWSAADDACPFCRELDGTVVGLDEPFFKVGEAAQATWNGEEILMAIDYMDIDGPPLHPNCLTDRATPIFTEDGWKPIAKIVVGQRVLTHKKRFQKVTKVHILPLQDVVRAKIFVTVGEKRRKIQLSVTEDHPVLVKGRGWVAAKDLQAGDLLCLLASKCVRCGKPVPYFSKYCSGSCCSKDITDRQWSNPKHRELISRKAHNQMLREYADGTRDRNEIIRKARKQMFHLVSSGEKVWPLSRPDVRDIIRKVTNTPEQRERSSLRMQSHNPTYIPEVRKRMTASYLRTIREHPEKHPNFIMAQKGFMSSIERKMKGLLELNNIPFVAQQPILQYFVDFAIPGLKIAIECDGEHWHDKTSRRDWIRQRRIENEGWTVVRFTENEINKRMDEVSDKILRIAANHTGQYGFIPCEVVRVAVEKRVDKGTLYNLSVEEDESFIAKGIIVHNCRCAVVAELDYEAIDRGGETLEEILAGDLSKSVKGKGPNDEEGRWVTMRGRRVFIREGQDPADALQESLDAMRPDTPATFHPGPDKENPAKGGKWMLANGKPLPEHVGNIRPDLTNVRISMDPEASMIWIGKDSAGRDQKKYKASVTDRNKAAKFARTHELIEKKPSILKENEGNLTKPETAEEALVTKLIFATGMRPGSTKDTKAEKQAYGATTLLAEHVKKSGDGVVLAFVGKSGKDLTIPVEDRSMAKVLLERKARGGKLFGTSEAKVLGYVHGLDGGKFKTKDIRTAVGTETALNKIKQMPAPKSMKEYKAAVKEVAVAVSTKLGNTPTIALQSYISPVVFAPWRQVWEGEKLVAVKSYSSFDKNTEVQFGEVEELPDWRKVSILDDEDPDDEELEQTPQDVVEVLGFDPLEFETETETKEETEKEQEPKQ